MGKCLKLTREELAEKPIPKPMSETHKVIPHLEFIQGVEAAFCGNDYEVSGDSIVVNESGNLLFATLELRPLKEELRSSREYGLTVGLRSSYNQRLPLGVVAGYRVVVCSNMAFSGDFSPIFRKHTKNAEVSEVAASAVGAWLKQSTQLNSQVQLLKDKLVPDREAEKFLYDFFVVQKLAPLRLLPEIHRSYFDGEYETVPQREAFRKRNLWSLSNAVTYAFRGLKEFPKVEATAALARTLALIA